MKIFKHPKILEVSLIELITFQLKYILLDYDLREADITVLAYIYIYGDKAIKFIVQDKLIRPKTAENYISGLRNIGLVHGHRNSTKVHPSIKVFKEDIKFVINLKLKETIND